MKDKEGEQMKKKLREICSRHFDDGTSGYCLSKKQFLEIDKMLDDVYERGWNDREKIIINNIVKA